MVRAVNDKAINLFCLLPEEEAMFLVLSMFMYRTSKFIPVNNPAIDSILTYTTGRHKNWLCVQVSFGGSSGWLISHTYYVY
jgi:hypothetical protein